MFVVFKKFLFVDFKGSLAFDEVKLGVRGGRGHHD